MHDTRAGDRELLRTNVARFMRREVAPIVADHERRGAFPWELMPRLREFGYLGGTLPEKSGGFGLSHADFAMLMEEAGYVWHSLRSTLNTLNMAILLLERLGTPTQKAAYLAPLLRGETGFWVGITEPDHGSDVAGMTLRAEDRGDHWLLNGTKQWITNGVTATHGLLMARVAPSAAGPGGITAFIVDRRQTAFEGTRLATMVLKATATSQLVFRDARVPRDNVLGEVGEGLRNILIALNFGRLSVAAGALGAARAALDLSIDYAKTRTQFGRPIGAYQLVQKLVVDMHVQTQAARGLVQAAAEALDSGRPARDECSVAKLFCAKAAHEVAGLAQQVHGGMGYSEDHPIERIFRDTRGAVIPEGTTEIQTLIIGRELLGLSAFGGS